MSKECSLYVIATIVDGIASAPIKVGIARDPKKRLADFQTASPHELVIALDIRLWSRRVASDIERACHAIARCTEFHLRGEWLNLSPGEASSLIGSAMDAALPPFREPYEARIGRLAAAWLRLRVCADTSITEAA